MPLKLHELDVIKALCSDVLSAKQVQFLEESAELVEFTPTGVGYHLTVRHECLPEERKVCNIPLIIGSFGDIQVGYIVFLGGGLLHIDCHQLCEHDIPDSFRDFNVHVST